MGTYRRARSPRSARRVRLSYVFDVYNLLVSGVPEKEIIDYLNRVEAEDMGLGSAADKETLLPVARALHRVDISP